MEENWLLKLMCLSKKTMFTHVLWHILDTYPFEILKFYFDCQVIFAQVQQELG